MTDASRWFIADPAPPDPAAYLVCVPHAGGSASAFHAWRSRLPPAVALLATQLPGRETRFAEPAVGDLAVLADGLAAAVSQTAGDTPVVLLGHSVGGLLAHEAARRLTAAGRAPRRLIVAGCRPPHRAGYRLSHLPDDALLAELDGLGALPGPVRGHPEIMAMFVHALRADLAAVEGYKPDGIGPPPCPLPCPVSAYGGEQDRLVPPSVLPEWNRYGALDGETRVFAGGHFFVHTELDAVLQAITEDLARL